MGPRLEPLGWLIVVSLFATSAGAQTEPPLPPSEDPSRTPLAEPPPAPAPGAPQPYPQPYPAQPYPAQPYPAQPYPAQPYPAQPYPAQPYPAHPPYGYGPPPPPAPPPPPERQFSLTLSPIHLLFPFVEIMAELRVTDGVGVSVIGGYGSFSASSVEDDSLSDDRLTVYEVGGQLSFYPLEPFESLVLGAELMWIGIDAEDYDNDSLRGTAEGFAVGPMVGYKYMADGGFTLLVQGGVQYVVAEADSGDEHEEDSAVLPLLNFNLGWSF